MKKMQALFALLCGVAMLSGCGSAPAGQAASANASAQSAAKTVAPLPEALKIDALDGCTFAAGFEASDVALNDDGMLCVHLTVYDYERFDLVEIGQLAAGDTLVIDQKDMVVETLEEDDSGYITINGGLEAGGCELKTDEDGVYYENLPDDAKSYHVLGEATLPIDQDFVFEDSSDLEKPEQKMYAGDFLMAMESSDRSFTPYATSVSVENGKIFKITQVYVP